MQLLSWQDWMGGCCWWPGCPGHASHFWSGRQAAAEMGPRDGKDNLVWVVVLRKIWGLVSQRHVALSKWTINTFPEGLLTLN